MLSSFQTLLTPQEPSKNGASLDVLIPSDVVTTQNEWVTTVSTQNNFHFHLSLNNLWNFDAVQFSSLQIMINGGTISKDDCDIIVSFSFDKQTYFTIVLRMDEDMDHKIFPKCDTFEPATQSIPIGNIKSLVDANNGKYRKINACNGTKFSSLSNMQPDDISSDSSWPIILKLNNYPTDNYITVEYTNPSMHPLVQSCGFANISLYDQTIDFYFGGDDYDESFQINSVNVTYFSNNTQITTTHDTIETNMKSSFNSLSEEQNESYINIQSICIISVCICVILFLCCGLLIWLRKKDNKQKHVHDSPNADDAVDEDIGHKSVIPNNSNEIDIQSSGSSENMYFMEGDNKTNGTDNYTVGEGVNNNRITEFI
eukprot:349996_1